MLCDLVDFAGVQKGLLYDTSDVMMSNMQAWRLPSVTSVQVSAVNHRTVKEQLSRWNDDHDMEVKATIEKSIAVLQFHNEKGDKVAVSVISINFKIYG